MEDVESFVKYYCGYLSTVQEQLMLHLIQENRIIGIARPIGQIKYMPLVSFGIRQPNVIDEAGHYQLAAKDSIRLYK